MKAKHCVLLVAATATILAIALRGAAEEVILSIIVVSTRQEAQTLAQRLKAGESFELLAVRHSSDPSAPEGGYLGEVKVEDLRPELQQAVKGLGPYDVGEPFALGNSYALLRVLPVRRVSLPRRGAQQSQTVAYLSGFEESLYFFSRLQKPDNYHQDLRVICDLKKTAIENAIKEAEARVLTEAAGSSKMQAHYMAAQLYAYRGEIERSISHLESALRLAMADGSDHGQALREKLGIGWLRKGEWDNCISNHNARSCIFPLTPAARHKMQEGSRRAFDLFSEYLKLEPEDLEVRWLLNLAAQTLGKAPRDIPPGLLLPESVLALPDPAREFIDVSHSAGLHRMNNAGGVVLDDMDNDGRPDIILSVVNACESLSYYHNRGDGTFENRTQAAKLEGQLGGINVTQTDYNNDGWLDLFVMRGGWEFPMRNSLLKNNGNGTFSDVTTAAGLAMPAYPTPTAAWADFDNDGLVDVFVGNERAPAQLFRNKGDGTFTDVAAQAGVARTAFVKGATWGDYDNDGYPDLYVSNYQQENFFYHNNRNGTFTEIAKALGVEGPLASFPTWFFDYSNDGCPDLFVSSYVQSVTEPVKELLRRPVTGETIRLYRNNCRGGFGDVSEQTGVNRISMAMGANFGDFDNDGYLDYYLGTGSPSYGALVPNLLFHNDSGKRFSDVTMPTGAGHLQKGHGIAFGDYDGDGDQDIFLHTGGAVPGDVYSNVLFRNPGTTKRSVQIKLVGRRSNRAAISARIKATIAEPGAATRSIHRVVTSGGSFGSSSFQQHIGIGQAERIQTLEVWWPTSNTRQVLSDVRPGRTIEIVEGQ